MSIKILQYIQDYDYSKILYPEYIYSDNFIVNPLNGNMVKEITLLDLNVYGFTNWERFEFLYPNFPKMSLKTYLSQFINIKIIILFIRIKLFFN